MLPSISVLLEQIRPLASTEFARQSPRSLRVEGADKPGVAATLTQALAKPGINLRRLSAAALGKRYVTPLALDTAADAAKAGAILKQTSGNWPGGISSENGETPRTRGCRLLLASAKSARSPAGGREA